MEREYFWFWMLVSIMGLICCAGPHQEDIESKAENAYVDSLEVAYISHIKIDSFRIQTIRKYMPIAIKCNANH